MTADITLTGIGAALLSVVVYLMLRHRRDIVHSEVERYERVAAALPYKARRVLFGGRHLSERNLTWGISAVTGIFAVVALLLWMGFVEESVSLLAGKGADSRAFPVPSQHKDSPLAIVFVAATTAALWCRAICTLLNREAIARRIESTNMEREETKHGEPLIRLAHYYSRLVIRLALSQFLIGAAVLIFGMILFR